MERLGEEVMERPVLYPQLLLASSTIMVNGLFTMEHRKVLFRMQLARSACRIFVKGLLRRMTSTQDLMLSL